MSRLKRVLLAAALSLAPLGAQAADLVVWWQRGFYAQEDEAVAEIVAAFEQETDQKVVVSFYTDMELPAKITVAPAWISSSTTAAGISGTSMYGQPSAESSQRPRAGRARRSALMGAEVCRIPVARV